MKSIVYLCGIIFLILSISTTGATLIKNEKIIIYRSQFAEKPIVIDGVIDADDEWLNAGSESLILQNSNGSRDMRIQFMNNEEWLFFTIRLDVENFTEATLEIFFDVEGDGILSPPEDGKVLNSKNTNVVDLYWNGEDWVEDLNNLNAEEFVYGKTTTSSSVSFEFKLDLTSSYIQYDGMQIPSPSNSFVAFTTQINIVEGNETNNYYFPTVSENVTDFVDLKLAGPEDQELQEYEPDLTTFTQPPGYDNTYVESGGLSFNGLFAFIGIIAISTMVRRRKRT